MVIESAESALAIKYLNIISRFSEEFIFLVSLNFDVTSWISDAGQDEALTQLLVVQERLIAIVYGTFKDFTGASTASSGLAGVRQVDTGFLGLIENVDVVRTFNCFLAVWSNEGNIIGSHHLNVGSSSSNSLSFASPYLCIVKVVFLDRDVSSCSRSAHGVPRCSCEHLRLTVSGCSHLSLGS